MTTGEWTYEGHKITVTQSGRFEVGGGDETFPTLSAAQVDIDKEIKVKALQAKEKLALAAVTSLGQAVIVTGLSRTNGDITTSPKAAGRFHTPALYPDTPAVRALLAEWLRLEKSLDAVRETLKPVTLASPHRYGNIPVEAYPALSQQLVTQYAAKLALAQKLEEPHG